jgi:hypothetical protein
MWCVCMCVCVCVCVSVVCVCMFVCHCVGIPTERQSLSFGPQAPIDAADTCTLAQLKIKGGALQLKVCLYVCVCVLC